MALYALSPPSPDLAKPLAPQGLILYSALTCASTPVALRYLYLQDKPPASPVLAAVQTSFAAIILVLISGGALQTCNAGTTVDSFCAIPAYATAFGLGYQR